MMKSGLGDHCSFKYKQMEIDTPPAIFISNHYILHKGQSVDRDMDILNIGRWSNSQNGTVVYPDGISPCLMGGVTDMMLV